MQETINECIALMVIGKEENTSGEREEGMGKGQRDYQPNSWQ